MSIASSSPLPIELATLADLPGILELLSTGYGYPYNSAPYWRWRYFENPMAEVAIYVARDEAGKVAAMQPVSAYSMVMRGQVCRVHLFTAAITHPDHRRRGLFRSLVQRIVADLERKGDFFVFTFPNELSARGFQQFAGWELREFLSLYVRPLSPLSWLRPRGTASPVTEAVPPLLPEHVGDLTLREASCFESDTAALLQAALPADSAYIQRSRDYLEWRYHRNPVSTYFMQQAYRGDDLVGYVVIKPSQLYGLRAGLIADLVACDERVASLLLRRVRRASHARGLQILAYLRGNFHPYRAAFWRAGFLPLPRRWLPRRFYLYTYPQAATGGPLAKAIATASWYVTWGDTDVV